MNGRYERPIAAEPLRAQPAETTVEVCKRRCPSLIVVTTTKKRPRSIIHSATFGRSSMTMFQMRIAPNRPNQHLCQRLDKAEFERRGFWASSPNTQISDTARLRLFDSSTPLVVLLLKNDMFKDLVGVCLGRLLVLSTVAHSSFAERTDRKISPNGRVWPFTY